jgi:hypothetical protein
MSLADGLPHKNPTDTTGGPGSTPTPNRVDAEQFLSALDPAAEKFTFQTFDDSPLDTKMLARKLHGSLEKRWDELASLNQVGAGVFVTVNATDFKGRSAANIKHVRALFIDLDGAPLPETFHVDPHIIVESSPGK